MSFLLVVAIIEGVALVVLICVVDWLLNRLVALQEQQARRDRRVARVWHEERR